LGRREGRNSAPGEKKGNFISLTKALFLGRGETGEEGRWLVEATIMVLLRGEEVAEIFWVKKRDPEGGNI